MDWFDVATGTIVVLCCVLGIAYYAWRSWQERAFNQYYAAQMTVFIGFLTVFLPLWVYGVEDNFTFGVGAALILTGLAQSAWFKRKKDARDRESAVRK